MPPVNQISITPRLAGFMDMMLLVIESEKTDRDVAAHASAMLAKFKAPVGVVLNKTRSYIPTALHRDREFLLGTSSARPQTDCCRMPAFYRNLAQSSSRSNTSLGTARVAHRHVSVSPSQNRNTT